MSSTREDLDSFNQFAAQRLAGLEGRQPLRSVGTAHAKRRRMRPVKTLPLITIAVTVAALFFAACNDNAEKAGELKDAPTTASTPSSAME